MGKNILEILSSKSAFTKMQAAIVAVIIIVAAIAGASYYIFNQPTKTTPSTGLNILTVEHAWPDYIDPSVAGDQVGIRTLFNLYDPLVQIALNGTIEPGVATSWSVSPDGKNWTFHLRNDVKFHAGNYMNSSDVAFSMNRLLTIGTGLAFMFTPYDIITTTPDNLTVNFALNQTYGPFLSVLGFFFIVNEALVLNNTLPGSYGSFGDYGQGWMLTHDAGSGPYMVSDFSLTVQLVMKRFSDYWGTFVVNAPDEVIYSHAESATQSTLIQQRQLDITDQWMPSQTLALLAQVAGINITSVQSGAQIQLTFHTRKAPTDDIYFREAMVYAFDYDQAVDILPGYSLSYGPVGVAVPGWDPNALQYQPRQNLTLALEYLHMSKYYGNLSANPVVCQWCSAVPDEQKIALLFAQDCQAIGITVQVVEEPWLTMISELSDMNACPNAMILWGCIGTYPEAGSILSILFSYAGTHGSSTTMNWLLNMTIDSMIKDAIATTNQTERFQKYYAIEQQTTALATMVQVADLPMRCAYQSYYINWPAVTLGYCADSYSYFDSRFISVNQTAKALGPP